MPVPDVILEDFIMLNNRVERVEISVSRVITRVDAILEKMEDMNKTRSQRKGVMKTVLQLIADVCMQFFTIFAL